MTEPLLPDIKPVIRPRFTSFSLYRNNVVVLDLTILDDVVTQTAKDITDLTVEARVFRDFDDPDTLVSTKTLANSDLEILEANNGKIRVRLTQDDLSVAGKPIFVAIFVDGTMVDLFGNYVSQSPL